VTLDLLLDAQRRRATAEADYAQSLFDAGHSTPQDRTLLKRAKLQSLIKAQDDAKRIARHVGVLSEKGAAGGEKEKFAQARDQYDLFARQVQQAFRELVDLDAPGEDVYEQPENKSKAATGERPSAVEVPPSSRQ
jgi:hypothetical protein